MGDRLAVSVQTKRFIDTICRYVGFVTGKWEHNKIQRSAKKPPNVKIRPSLAKGRSSSPLCHYVILCLPPPPFLFFSSLFLAGIHSVSFCNSITNFLSEKQFQAMPVFQHKKIGITAADKSCFLHLFFSCCNSLK